MLTQWNLYVVNLSDIESISVLKDADAIAIYGFRGANGVVIITAKKKRERLGDLNVYDRIGEVAKTIK